VRYRISGFNDNGEARIVDEDGRQVATGFLIVDSIGEPERGDLLDVTGVEVTWSRQEPDLWNGHPIDSIDWDSFPR
jgi:hypothetical protein